MKKTIAVIAAVLLLCVALRVALRHAEPLAQPRTVTTAVLPPEVYLGFVPGGVRTLQQFSAALYADKALAAQYQGFDFSKARFENTTQVECLHVAYRRGDKFAWTAKCKLLPKGTLILTDGRYRIRAACANMLTAAPQVPTIPSELEPNALDVPDNIPALPEPSAPVLSPTVVTPSTPPAVTTGMASPPLSPWVPFTPMGGFCCVGVTPTAVPDGDDWKVTVGTVAMLVFLIWAYTPKLRRTK